MVKWFKSLTRNHKPITTVNSNPTRDQTDYRCEQVKKAFLTSYRRTMTLVVSETLNLTYINTRNLENRRSYFMINVDTQIHHYHTSETLWSYVDPFQFVTVWLIHADSSESCKTDYWEQFLFLLIFETRMNRWNQNYEKLFKNGCYG